MTIPTPAFTSADVASECSLSTPWASNAAGLLAVLADGAIPYTSADLAGRSSADYVPNALAWSDFSSTTDDQSGGNYVESITQTLAGINQTITLLVDTSSWSCTVSGDQPSGSGTLDAYVGGSSVASMSLFHSSTGANNGTASRSMTFSVSNGSVVKFGLTMNVSDGIGYANGGTGATFSVKNNSSGNTVLDTFVASCGASTAGGA